MTEPGPFDPPAPPADQLAAAGEPPPYAEPPRYAEPPPPPGPWATPPLAVPPPPVSWEPPVPAAQPGPWGGGDPTTAWPGGTATSSRRPMLALTVGVLAILGVAVGWTVLNPAGPDPTPPGGERASGTALPGRPSAPTAGDHLGSTSDQASLARVVPSELAGRCDPANVSDPRIAAVTCTTADGYVVAYEAYPSRATLDDDWRAMLRERELTIDDGACESGKPGEAGWYYTDGDPDLDEGRDACFLDVAGPVLVWTDYVTRTRTWLYGPADTSIEATFERWNEGDLDPVRSGDGSVPQPRSGRPS